MSVPSKRVLVPKAPGEEEDEPSAKKAALDSDDGGPSEAAAENAVGEPSVKKARERKYCSEPNCKSWTQPGGKCKAHGGGKRCEHPGCDKAAQGASSSRCFSHGGGRKCNEDGCEKKAQGASGLCVAHGGGPRCIEVGCSRSARGNR